MIFVFYLRDMFFDENLFLDICGNQCIMKAIGNLFQTGESVRGPVWICRRLMRRGESGLLKAEPGFSCCRRIPMRRPGGIRLPGLLSVAEAHGNTKIQSADTGTIGFCHMCQEERTCAY